MSNTQILLFCCCQQTCSASETLAINTYLYHVCRRLKKREYLIELAVVHTLNELPTTAKMISSMNGTKVGTKEIANLTLGQNLVHVSMIFLQTAQTCRHFIGVSPLRNKHALRPACHGAIRAIWRTGRRGVTPEIQLKRQQT